MASKEFKNHKSIEERIREIEKAKGVKKASDYAVPEPKPFTTTNVNENSKNYYDLPVRPLKSKPKTK